MVFGRGHAVFARGHVVFGRGHVVLGRGEKGEDFLFLLWKRFAILSSLSSKLPLNCETGLERSI